MLQFSCLGRRSGFISISRLLLCFSHLGRGTRELLKNWMRLILWESLVLNQRLCLGFEDICSLWCCAKWGWSPSIGLTNNPCLQFRHTHRTELILSINSKFAQPIWNNLIIHFTIFKKLHVKHVYYTVQKIQGMCA